MEKKLNHPIWVCILNIVLFILIAASGIYVLIEKKMLIAGKYSGNVYFLSDIESLFISMSLFMVASFFILILFENKYTKKISEWLLGLGIVLFLFSSFV